MSAISQQRWAGIQNPLPRRLLPPSSLLHLHRSFSHPTVQIPQNPALPRPVGSINLHSHPTVQISPSLSAQHFEKCGPWIQPTNFSADSANGPDPPLFSLRFGNLFDLSHRTAKIPSLAQPRPWIRNIQRPDLSFPESFVASIRRPSKRPSIVRSDGPDILHRTLQMVLANFHPTAHRGLCRSRQPIQSGPSMWLIRRRRYSVFLA